MNVINNLYEVDIKSNTTQLNIQDGLIQDNTTAIITVKTTDFNNNIASNKSINISCDKGYFRYIINPDTNISTSITQTQSYTGITNSNGVLKLVYVASEWGLCTISADTKKIQLFVNGFKEVNANSTNGVVFQVDESQRACRLKWNFVSTGLSQTKKKLDTVTFPKSIYAPPFLLYIPTYRPDFVFILYPNGEIWGRTNGSITTEINMDNHVELFEWHY